jgi:uncharacterized tellurite resistance protein B-like protein
LHIIGILIGIIGFVAVWYWRLKMLGDVAKDGRKVAETVVNLPRRMMFKHRSGKGGLDVVDDPREAATILMLEVAMARGPLTENQQAAIRGEIMHHFDFTERDADELIAQAGWLTRDAGTNHAIMTRMTDFIQNTSGVGPKQIVDMDSMLVAVSEAEGEPLEAQLDLLTIFRGKTGLRV